MLKLEKSWHEVLREEMGKPYIKQLKKFLAEEAARGEIVFPPEPLVFSSFLHTPFEKVKVVIMGQDPYHGPGQAHGLSFSVPCGMPQPPSLKNIFKELQADLGLPISNEGCLSSWAKQGVLMLNATLTVRTGQPRSHYGKGWEVFTDTVLRKVYDRTDPVVFILWGKSAQEKIASVMQGNPRHHALLTSSHPSPFSAHGGFFGCRHFSKTNNYLKKWGKKEINWSVEKI